MPHARKLFTLILFALVDVATLAAEGDCEAEVAFVTPTPPPAAIEATVEARVAERLQSQALDVGTVPASPAPTATLNPRMECDSPDLLARAGREYNLNHRPDKIAHVYDIQEASRGNNELKCAALVEQVAGEHFQFDYGYDPRRGIYGRQGYRVEPPMRTPRPTATLTPIPGPTATAPPTPHLSLNAPAHAYAFAASNGHAFAHGYRDSRTCRDRNPGAYGYTNAAGHRDAYSHAYALSYAQTDGAGLQPPRTSRAL